MINRLEFTINIKAERSTIWNALWDETAYRKWTAVFSEGSYAVTNDWKEGTIVHFLAPDKTGIYSMIEKHIPNKFIQFKHIGNVLNGTEQPVDDDTRKWSGATEMYSIIEGKDIHTLKVEIDVMDEHLEFMQNTFPKALETIKYNCNE